MEKGELDEKADSFTAFKVQICFYVFSFFFIFACLVIVSAHSECFVAK